MEAPNRSIAQDEPLSYRGARQLLGLVVLLVIIALILRALESVLLLFAIVFLVAMVLNPIVVWLERHRFPRGLTVALVILGLLVVAVTVVLFAIPPLARQVNSLIQNAPHIWNGIRGRMDVLGERYPAIRNALPQTDEIISRIADAAGTVGNILLRSTIGFVGWVFSIAFAILLLFFVLANPVPLVGFYLMLAPARFREQAKRTLARLMHQMVMWARGVAINGAITGISIGILLWAHRRSAGADVRRVRVPGRISSECRRIFCCYSDSVCRFEHGRDEILAGAGRNPARLPSGTQFSCAVCAW